MSGQSMRYQSAIVILPLAVKNMELRTGENNNFNELFFSSHQFKLDSKWSSD
jgi:hypothetical protein